MSDQPGKCTICGDNINHIPAGATTVIGVGDNRHHQWCEMMQLVSTLKTEVQECKKLVKELRTKLTALVEEKKQ